MGVNAQSGKSKKAFRNGIYYIDAGNYTKAIEQLLPVLELDKNSSNLNYLIGKCHFNLKQHRDKSIPYLIKATSSVKSNAKWEQFDETSAPVDVHFLLGKMYHFNNLLDSAEVQYKIFENLSVKRGDKVKARSQLESIAVARKMLSAYQPYSAENLGNKINSPYSDYSPVFSGDGNVMAYTTYRDGEDQVFVTQKNNSEWDTPENITEQLKSKGKTFTGAMTADGKGIYLININDYGSDIYYTEFDGKKWSKMKPLESTINSSFYETSVCINNAGNELYFSSDIPGGLGGLDIYYSKKDAGGKWQLPENLGPRVNTKGDDESPYLSKDGNVLFFSSNGLETMGGYDIFMSERIGEDAWSRPINLGYPLNTTHDDFSFIAIGDGSKGYVVKDFPGGIGLADIYFVQISGDSLAAKRLKAKYSGFITKYSLADLAELEPLKPLEPVQIEDSNDFVQQISISPTQPESEEEMQVIEPLETKVQVDSQQKSTGSESDQMSLPDPAKRAYTVQIIALKNPKPKERFNSVGDVKRSDGADSYSRYTVGYFTAVKDAQNKLKFILSQGYTTAFIRDVRTVSNYFNNQ